MSASATPRDAVMAFASGGDWARVVPAARQALAADPEDAAIHAMLAVALANTDRTREGIEAGKRAIALDPELAFGHYALGWALLGDDDVKGAERAAQESLRLDPDSDGYALLGQVFTRQRRWREVLDAAAEGLRLDPAHLGCTNLRSLALGSLGRAAEAASSVRESLEIDPDNPLSHQTRGWLLLRESRHQEALESFREALRLDPGLAGARAGIVEALKARNGVYRLFLRYSLWMTTLDARTRWFIIIGLFVAMRVVRATLQSNPGLRPVLGPLLVAYLLFVVTTWVAAPLSDLLLRLNPFGRLVLSKIETLAANLVGGCLAVAAIAAAVFAATATASWLVLAAVCVLMLGPIGITSQAHGTRAWRPLLAFAGLIAIVAVAAVALAFAGRDGATSALTATLLGAILFSWVANYLIIKHG